MGKEYIYSLRICICPGFQEERKMEELMDFCQKAGINDVQFFINSEELNQGHLTISETKKWLDMIRSFKPYLEKSGITVSLNPWNTTLHADRGRKLKEGQNFTTMVDMTGKKAEAVACPLDSDFQSYIREVFGLYAEIGFNTIWIEDDFRLHNHPPLKWGGCFCKLHMDKYSECVGKQIDRESFINGIIAPGNPHPYRQIWLDTARDTMNDFAELLGKAVHDKAPETRVGLMSSVPEIHCTEGRDWKKIFKNISGKTRPLNRPHLPAYDETTGKSYALNFQRISRLSAAITGDNVELLPELDNLPHTTFAKSHKFACMEIESTLALGAEGITINIFDMIGNGINQKQNNAQMLLQIKPYLNAVRGLELKGNQEKGICVMFSEKSSYTIHADKMKDLTAIQPWETFWAEYLAVYGIAYRYCNDINIKNQIVAVSGQFFRNLTQVQIERLFTYNNVILDGEAVEVLVDMGMGDILHVRECHWYKVNSGYQSFEQVVDGNIYQGLQDARMSAQGMSELSETGDYLKIEYDRDPVNTLTVLNGPDERAVGNGLIQITEKVVVFPYGHMRAQYNFLLNPIRQELLGGLIENLKNTECPVMVKNCEYVTVNHFSREGNHVLLLFNYSLDDFRNPNLVIPFEISKVYEVSRESGEYKEVPFKREGKEVTLFIELLNLSSRCIVCVTK